MHYFFYYTLFISFNIFISSNTVSKNGIGLFCKNPIGFYRKEYKPNVNFNISFLLNDSDTLVVKTRKSNIN